MNSSFYYNAFLYFLNYINFVHEFSFTINSSIIILLSLISRLLSTHRRSTTKLRVFERNFLHLVDINSFNSSVPLSFQERTSFQFTDFRCPSAAAWTVRRRLRPGFYEKSFPQENPHPISRTIQSPGNFHPQKRSFLLASLLLLNSRKANPQYFH